MRCMKRGAQRSYLLVQFFSEGTDAGALCVAETGAPHEKGGATGAYVAAIPRSSQRKLDTLNEGAAQ